MYEGFKVQDFRTLKTLIQLLDENERFGVDEQNVLSSSDEEDNNMENHTNLKLNLPNFPSCRFVWLYGHFLGRL